MLVHRAAGGVGFNAVQIAVALGAHVIGTASPKNHGFLRDAGAAEVLDYSAGPISEQLSEPVDAVLDLVGGETLADAPKQVARPRRGSPRRRPVGARPRRPVRVRPPRAARPGGARPHGRRRPAAGADRQGVPAGADRRGAAAGRRRPRARQGRRHAVADDAERCDRRSGERSSLRPSTTPTSRGTGASWGCPGWSTCTCTSCPTRCRPRSGSTSPTAETHYGAGWPIAYALPVDERLAVLERLGVRAFPTLPYPHKPGMAAWLNDWSAEFAQRTVRRCCSRRPSIPSRRRPAYVARGARRAARGCSRCTCRWAGSTRATRCSTRSGRGWRRAARRWSSTADRGRWRASTPDRRRSPGCWSGTRGCSW